MTKRKPSPSAWLPVRVRINPQGKVQIAFDKRTTKPLYESIRAGDRVSIVNRFGQVHTGRAVMLGPGGWVLNMGGPHGTPDIADDRNVVAVKKGSSGSRTAYGRMGGNRRGNPTSKSRKVIIVDKTGASWPPEEIVRTVHDGDKVKVSGQWWYIERDGGEWVLGGKASAPISGHYLSQQRGRR